MRIISGKYKGRKLDGHNIDGTRPTMDRIKESIIGMIQIYIKNSDCLDLFAGSGSVGLELLSNGANSCYFVDNNKKVIDTIRDNLNKINVEEKYYLFLNDYHTSLKIFKDNNVKFDLIFLDPPYDKNYINESLKLIIEYNLLKEKALIICEYEKEKIECNLNVYKEKKYGDKNIIIYINN